MLRFSRPTLPLLAFLAVVIAIGAVLGHIVDATGIALFLFFIAGISAKPAWRFWFDAPGDVDSGRTLRISSWRRASATSPDELRRLPRRKDL